ncbi:MULTISPECIES: hypothetical protein [unclassified Clostridium]|nr:MULTISPECIES: hypothetical protein [unclassified Clostridium]
MINALLARIEFIIVTNFNEPSLKINIPLEVLRREEYGESIIFKLGNL